MGLKDGVEVWKAGRQGVMYVRKEEFQGPRWDLTKPS